MTEFMRHTEAIAWSLENDPRLRSTEITLALLERSPDWDEIRYRFELMCRKLAPIRRRLVESPRPAPHRWEDCPDFDFDFHMRRVSASKPGTFDTVLEMVRVAAMEEFDHARPLWNVTLIDGLDNGGAALMCKFHHALVDGVGALQLAMTMLDLTEEPPERQVLSALPDVSRPSRASGYRDMARYGAGLAARTARGAVRGAPELMLQTLRRPLSTAVSTSAVAASVYRSARPVSRTGSPIMTERTLRRRVGVHEVSVSALRSVAKHRGGTLNDAFLAGIAGGLRRYHEKHGAAVGDLHLAMPVSLRSDTDNVGGNRFAPMRFELPVGVADPTKRIELIHQRVDALRREPALRYTELVAAASNLLPRKVIGSVMRRTDVLASNVPGVPVPVYIGGARVHKYYPLGSTVGAAVCITLLSYVDTCAMGISVDSGAVPDFEVFHDCLVAGFDEVLALGD
jgi:WS/DGAT/MGAT family acyltransferase